MCPGVGPPCEALTEIYSDSNDPEGMVREWQTITRRFPKGVLAWYSLGLALEYLGRREEAIAA